MLLVDEASMLSVILFHKLDYVARVVRERQQEWFVGIKLVFAGEFCRLPPFSPQKVTDGFVFNLYSSRHRRKSQRKSPSTVHHATS